ncbi:MAG: flap structure-specific endonuclease, partial [Candidatus Aenigmarchaeota archaeon]|nr:flap structure-specific endonuclease [Candidatus Aenigmarchaeota archaeon]
MGVKISKTLPKKEIRMEDLSGKILAVDGFNILYQFLTTIKDRETGEPFRNSKGNVT